MTPGDGGFGVERASSRAEGAVPKRAPFEGGSGIEKSRLEGVKRQAEEMLKGLSAIREKLGAQKFETAFSAYKQKVRRMYTDADRYLFFKLLNTLKMPSDSEFERFVKETPRMIDFEGELAVYSLVRSIFPEEFETPGVVEKAGPDRTRMSPESQPKLEVVESRDIFICENGHGSLGSSNPSQNKFCPKCNSPLGLEQRGRSEFGKRLPLSYPQINPENGDLLIFVSESPGEVVLPIWLDKNTQRNFVAKPSSLDISGK